MIPIIRLLCVFLTLIVATPIVFGQDKIGRESHERLKIDFRSGELNNKDSKGSNKIPFDVPFILEGEVPKDIVKVEVAYVESDDWGNRECDCSCFDYPYQSDRLPCYDPKTIQLTSNDSKKKKQPCPEPEKIDKKPCQPKCKRLCPWKLSLLSDLQLCEEKEKCENHLFWVEVPPLKANKDYKFFFKFHIRPIGRDSIELQKGIANILLSKHGEFVGSSALSSAGITASDIERFIRNYYSRKSYDPVLSNQNDLLNNTSLFGSYLVNDGYLFGHEEYEPWNYTTTNRIYKSKDIALRDSLLSFKARSTQLFKNLGIQQFDATYFERLSRGLIRYSEPLAVLKRPELGIDTAITKQYIENIKVLSDTLKIRKIQNRLDYKNLTQSEKKAFQNIINGLERVQSDLEKYHRFAAGFNNSMNELARTIINQISFTGGNTLSSIADFKTRTEYYVTADLGIAALLYENRYTNKLVTYYGINFNPFPVNRQVPYSFFSNGFSQMHKNLSIVVGITAQSNDDRVGRRNSLNGQSLMTGIGLRISDPIRLTPGLIWNEIENFDGPFSTKNKLRAYPYISLSFDLDVITYVKAIANPLFGKEYK